MSKRVYFVEASYPGGINIDTDAILIKAVGRESDGSGCMLTGNFERDLSWDFVKKNDAEQAASRLRLTGVKGLKVFADSYDD